MANWAVGRKALWAAGLTPLLVLIFVTSLTASFAIPNDPIVENLLKRESLLLDRRANNGRVIDADTECIGLSVGLYKSDAQTTSPLERAVHAESLYGCDQFINWLKTDETSSDRDYFRYWHGYTIITRPILALLPYNDLRGHLFNLSVVLFGCLLWRLGRDFSALTALAIALPFFVLNAVGFWVVGTKAVTWFLMIGGMLVVSRRKNSAAGPPLLLFFVLGSLTAFFDFLTTPMLVFALPALVYFLYASRSGAVSLPMRQLFWLGCFWAAGYIGLWVAKFGLAAAILDLPVWQDVIEAALFRFRGTSEHIDGFLPGSAIYANATALKVFWGPVALALFVIAPFATQRRRARWRHLWEHGRVFLCIAAIPVIWLEVMSNHSQIHAAFTHLNFAPFMVIAGLTMWGERGILALKGQGELPLNAL